MNIDKAIEILQSGLITQQEQTELAKVLQAKREWVGLTDDERNEIYETLDAYADLVAIEAKLRERNT